MITDGTGQLRPLRVCITGAECTGKTTLANTLGSYLGAPVVHESVRDYFAEKAAHGDVTVYASDLIHVVELQVRTEDAAPRDVPLLVLDTDVYTIAIWQQRYFEHRYEELEHLADQRQKAPSSCIDLYVLCGPEIPFEHDSVRGSDDERHRMHEVFRANLKSGGRRFIEVEGSVKERCTQAVEEIERIAAEQSRQAIRSRV